MAGSRARIVTGLREIGTECRGWFVVGAALARWAWSALEEGPTGPGKGAFPREVAFGGERGAAATFWWCGSCLGVGSQETNLGCGRSHREFKPSPRRGFEAKNQGLAHRRAGTLTSSSWDPFSPARGPSPRSCFTATTKPPCCPGALLPAGLQPRDARVTTPHPDGGPASWEQGLQGVRGPGSDREDYGSQQGRRGGTGAWGGG